MLYISTTHGAEFSWNIGQSFPNVSTDLIGIVQADGDEKERIRLIFGDTIPMPSCRVAQWYGDIARTICLNLKTNARIK